MLYTPTSDQLSFLEATLSPDRAASFISTFESLGGKYCPGWPDQFGILLKDWSNKTNTPINSISLFSGAGGLDIGFHDAGFKVKKMVELEERFVATLKANTGKGKYFSDTDIYCGDICLFQPDNLGKIDFIIGGPPCQTFSAAGRRAAGVQGTDDPRGKLFLEYIRVLDYYKPLGFLFENVYGIIGAQNGKAWDAIVSSFRELGYHISFRIVDAADYGVPQHRERLIIVGSKGAHFNFPRPTHGPDSENNTPYYQSGTAVMNALFDSPPPTKGINGRFGHLLNEIPPGLNYSYFTEEMGHPKPIFSWRSKFSDFLYKAHPEMPVRTIKAQGGQYTGPFHWENRHFTINEFKRLQTFPDAYHVCGNRQTAIHQIGNSVPPQLARVLAVSILDQLFDRRPLIPLTYIDNSVNLNFRKRKHDLTAFYKKIASDAISQLNDSHSENELLKDSFYFSLSDNFSYCIQKEPAKSLCKVAFTPSGVKWKFKLQPTSPENTTNFTLCIKVTDSTLNNLPFNEIILTSNTLTDKIFTGAWKTIEHTIARHNIKADLVQLSGYYQYQPKITCTFDFDEASYLSNKNFWLSIRKLVSGDCIRQIISYEEFSDAFDVPDALIFALWLKSIGYEIRNHKTNPQILKNHLLLPYVFPSLSPLSVQLSKNLE